MTPRVAIALGDPAGIGPELALKAATDPRVRALCTPVLFGAAAAVAAHRAAAGCTAPVVPVARADQPAPAGAVALVETGPAAPPRLGVIAAEHGRAALDAAGAAIDAARAGLVAGVVACPQTEAAIHQAGIDFDGYPSFVARRTGIAPEDAFLMLCFDATRIVHATLHVSLARAITLITPERLARVLAATHATLRHHGISAPRIAVSGLNPHAGEAGAFGREEIEIIAPAIAAAVRDGLTAEGPFGADTMFHRPGYDAFVVMYHDQGHLAAKLMARNRTAGMTIGTPVVFSSVAHGSALDIAGRGEASAEAVVEAIRRVIGAGPC